MIEIEKAGLESASAISEEVRKRAPGGGRKPLLDAANELALVELLRANPTATMGELVLLAKAELGLTLGIQTLQKALKRQGISKRQVKRDWVPPGGENTASKAKKRYGYLPRHRVAPAPGRYPTDVTDAEWALIADLFEHKAVVNSLMWTDETCSTPCSMLFAAELLGECSRRTSPIGTMFTRPSGDGCETTSWSVCTTGSAT